MFDFDHFDPASTPSPCYVLDKAALRKNLEILSDIRRRTGTGVLLALKGFAMTSVAPLVAEYLDGVAASGLHEARLGAEAFGREVHTFSPAFREDEIDDVLRLSDYVVFNSLSQWQRFQSAVQNAARPVFAGLRINPEHSEVKTALYDPCAPGSRLGITAKNLEDADLNGISGFHVHALCEQGADALERLLGAVEDKFGSRLPHLDWLNLGGGHHITRDDYDRDLLCRLIDKFQQKYGLKIYLEPGEAVALDAGVLVATVLDIVDNRIRTAILDVSATCHMPDVLEMPYRPEVFGAGHPSEKPHTYRLGGASCLAGDVIGDYSFASPLSPGDRLVFCDMAIYTTVKTTMFNGVRHPAIATWDPATSKALQIVRTFTYEDYKHRQG